MSRIWLCGSLAGVTTVYFLRSDSSPTSVRQYQIPSALPSTGDRVRMEGVQVVASYMPGKRAHIHTDQLLPKVG